jgi:hypothetical protein
MTQATTRREARLRNIRPLPFQRALLWQRKLEAWSETLQARYDVTALQTALFEKYLKRKYPRPVKRRKRWYDFNDHDDYHAAMREQYGSRYDYAQVEQNWLTRHFRRKR